MFLTAFSGCFFCMFFHVVVLRRLHLAAPGWFRAELSRCGIPLERWTIHAAEFWFCECRKILDSPRVSPSQVIGRSFGFFLVCLVLVLVSEKVCTGLQVIGRSFEFFFVGVFGNLPQTSGGVCVGESVYVATGKCSFLQNTLQVCVRTCHPHPRLQLLVWHRFFRFWPKFHLDACVKCKNVSKLCKAESVA